MPLYEYVCRKCDHGFEELVFGDARPACPKCSSADAERVLSVTAAVRSGGDDFAPAGCGRCGHPDGPGACARGRAD
jgi:putative FmdB family regulatory protein